MIKSCMALVRLVLPFHAAAWKASSKPIQALLDTTDPVAQDGLTGVWRDTTQSQLNAVGITVNDFPSDPHSNENLARDITLSV